MARRVIALDIGASALTIAEFAVLKPAGLELEKYAIGPLGHEPGSDADPSAYVVATIRELMRENGIKPGPVLISVSGKDIFPRYVNLPPVTHDKIDQIVLYEAQQNVPFSIEEVVWDYQLIEREDGGHSVMLVAIKTEVIKKLTDCVQAAGMEPEIVDVAPMALYNLVRYNYGETMGCTLVMDIGARATNLVFIEGKRIFTRSLPIAGNTITQELMKEFELPFKDAEELKIAHAFVAFGGVVEGADSQVVNRTSKTVRSVMTRLHAEISRSINFYRSQQRGSKPYLLLLTGGSSVIRETDTFLREKLGLRVAYLNPFQKVTVASHISANDIAAKMHLLGEVTGLALRRAFSCPMELNLMPPSLVSRKTIHAKIPFLVITAVGIFFIIVCWWGYFRSLRVITEKNLALVQSQIQALDSTQQDMDLLAQEKKQIENKANRLLELISLRTRWIEMIKAIHSNILDGMWLTSITPVRKGGGDDAPISHIGIEGVGFVDKVISPEEIGEFGNALKQAEYFSDEVEVKNVKPSDYSLEFTMDIGLKEPLSF